MKEAILIGPYIGELGWEFMRFAPLVPFKKQQNNINGSASTKFIVYTRPDRFDLYGKFADVLVPLELPKKYKNCIQDCHTLQNFPNEQYENLANEFKAKYKEEYNILEHVYPKLKKRQFQNKNQINPNQRLYKYEPRKENFEIINNQIPQDKPFVIIGPRFRKRLRRNWFHYQELYEMIQNDDKLMKSYNFIICGKRLTCISDNNNKFFDINDLNYGKNSSLIGVTIALMKNQLIKLVVGSQSAIPNIGMILGIPVLSWGDQKHLHTKVYNVFKTPIDFIESKNYDVRPEIVFDKMKNNLRVGG